jgi:hypothetical protein
MTVAYWIAKYVEDPFRNEPRNVGVIVRSGDTAVARFVGERETGTIDRRLLGQRFQYPEIYLQWVTYWRNRIETGTLEDAVKAASSNYYLVYGGEVTDTASDSVDTVCAFLYTLLVSDEPIMAAFEVAAEADETKGLSSEISRSFTELNLLGDSPKLGVPHPIKRDETVRGKHVSHRPSFSQKNGALYVYEAIDLTFKRPKLIRERAGWMAYMYNDIKEAEGDAKAYSIYRPNKDDAGGIVEEAKKILSGASVLVNWSDDKDRRAFLDERRRVAESVQLPRAD